MVRVDPSPFALKSFAFTNCYYIDFNELYIIIHLVVTIQNHHLLSPWCRYTSATLRGVLLHSPFYRRFPRRKTLSTAIMVGDGFVGTTWWMDHLFHRVCLTFGRHVVLLLVCCHMLISCVTIATREVQGEEQNWFEDSKEEEILERIQNLWKLHWLISLRKKTPLHRENHHTC